MMLSVINCQRSLETSKSRERSQDLLYINVSSALSPHFEPSLCCISDITSTPCPAGWFLLPLTCCKTKSNCISRRRVSSAGSIEVTVQRATRVPVYRRLINHESSAACVTEPLQLCIVSAVDGTWLKTSIFTSASKVAYMKGLVGQPQP